MKISTNYNIDGAHSTQSTMAMVIKKKRILITIVTVKKKSCQSKPEYARVCQSMPGYARVCMSRQEYA